MEIPKDGPLMEQARRAAYLLRLIANGDHKALENAADCADQLHDALKDAGMSEPWLDEGREEE